MASSIKPSKQKYKLLAICYNNIGCFYRKTVELEKSLESLDKALKHLIKGHFDIVAETYLNISSILSESNQHAAALSYGLKSINILKSHLKTRKELATTLVIGLNNVAIEYEYQREGTEALCYYIRTYKLSLRHLGKDNTMTQTLQNSIQTLSPE